jgi:RNA polymerase sigma-70 factor (ECF subfamily)
MCLGNVDGLGYLVEKYGLKAVRVATLITCDRALAEDVVQEAFIRAYERIHQFDIDKPFGPWFLRSISNASLRAVQQRGRTSPLEDASDRGDAVPGDALAPSCKTPEELIETAETNQQIWQALEGLPPIQRHALVLRYVYGLSERELSSALSCPAGTVKWRLSAARAKLKGLLTLGRKIRYAGGRDETDN